MACFDSCFFHTSPLAWFWLILAHLFKNILGLVVMLGSLLNVSISAQTPTELLKLVSICQAEQAVKSIKSAFHFLDEKLHIDTTVYGACVVRENGLPLYSSFSSMTPDSWFEMLLKRSTPSLSSGAVEHSSRCGFRLWSSSQSDDLPVQLLFPRKNRQFHHGYIYHHHARRRNEQSLFLIAGTSHPFADGTPIAPRFRPITPDWSPPHDSCNQKNQIPEFSSRERELIYWLVEGKSANDIAVILGKSNKAVRYQIQRVYLNLNAKNRAQAIAAAFSVGLIG